MKIKEIIWLEDVLDKLEKKHNIKQNEVIEVLESKPRFRFVEKGHRKGEDVYGALGQTFNGRYLIVFFVFKRNAQALIISARDMTNLERRLYEQK